MIEYKERGTTGVRINITITSKGTILMETCNNEKTQKREFSADFRLERKVSKFLEDSGIPDRSGMKNRNLNNLITAQTK